MWDSCEVNCDKNVVYFYVLKLWRIWFICIRDQQNKLVTSNFIFIPKADFVGSVFLSLKRQLKRHDIDREYRRKE